MPLLRNQLKSDPVTERLTGHSTFEFRKLVAFGWVCAFLGTAAIALFSRGVTAWIAACFSIVTATLGLYRLVKERALLRDYEKVVATVSERIRTEGPEGGYFYSVHYQFLAPDGKVYLGKSGSTQRELPPAGGTIPVLYRRGDPEQNEALATFWLFRFTYTGTE